MIVIIGDSLELIFRTLRDMAREESLVAKAVISASVDRKRAQNVAV